MNSPSPKAAVKFGETQLSEDGVPGLVRRIGFFSKVLTHDALAKARYGWSAPVKFQRVYVDPLEISLSTKRRFRRQTGLLAQRCPWTVVGGEWDKKSKPIEIAHPGLEMARAKIQSCKSWVEIGEVDRVLEYLRRDHSIDGLTTREQVFERYVLLDKLIQELSETGRLRSKKELKRFHFREWDGINVMITRDGTICAAGGGNHRLGIAQGLRLKSIPASILCVHPACIKSGKWEQILERSKSLYMVNSRVAGN